MTNLSLFLYLSKIKIHGWDQIIMKATCSFFYSNYYHMKDLYHFEYKQPFKDPSTDSTIA